MTPEDALADEAHVFARALRGLTEHEAGVTRDMLDVHLRSYRPRLGRDLTCPRCWVKDGARSMLRSVPGTEEYDVLRCNSSACGAEFIVPF